MADTREVMHPGKRLLSEITKRGMKQSELAIRTGMSAKHISTVINGTKDISASFARKLDIALGDKSGTWFAYQTEYDVAMAELKEKNGITDEEKNILKGMKDIVEYFLKRGIMHNHCGDAEKIIQLREFLRVNNLSAIPKITYNAVYRAQVTTRTNIDLYTLFAWQRMCEVLTDDAPINCQFNADKLLNSLDKIKELMFETSTNTNKLKSTLKSIFADCGVSFEIVHHFRGAPVQGFIKQTDSGKVILCVTIRGKNADRFWFSLFHEIGHLLNGDLNTRFVDFDSVKSELENKADIFARDTLIDPSLYKSFILSGKYYMLDEIKKFSTSIAVPHWVVIGRLHSDEWLDWNCFAYEIPKFEWVED